MRAIQLRPTAVIIFIVTSKGHMEYGDAKMQDVMMMRLLGIYVRVISTMN